MLDWVNTADVVPVVYAEGEDGVSLNTPRRPLLELVFVTHGRFPMRVVDRQAPVAAGDLALINAHFGNYGAIKPGDRYACVSFSVKGVDRFAALTRAPVLETCSVADVQAMQALYRRVDRQYHAPRTMHREYRLKAEVLQLLTALLEEAQHHTSRRYPDLSDRVSRAVDFIQDNHADPHTDLARIAAHARCSPAHLCRLFRERLDTSPMGYLQEVRVRRAGDLLARTDLGVKQIAAMVGYADQLYFSRVFRKVRGVSPRDCRDERDENGAPATGETRTPARSRAAMAADAGQRV